MRIRLFDKFFRENRKKKYVKYLQSRKWKNKRKLAIADAGGRCELCNCPHNLEVHHRTYKNIYNETSKDLTVLCKDCHFLFHLYKKLWQK